MKSDGRASAGLPLQKQKMHSLAHWRGTICSKRESEVFAFGALEFDFPILAALLAHFEHQFSFAGRLKTKIEIVANDSSVDLYYSVAAFEFHLSAQAVGQNFADLDPAAANVGDCWSDCKFVHRAKR